MNIMRSLLACLLIAGLAPLSSAQISITIDDCGTIVEGVECDLFAADGGGLYIVGSSTPLSVGDRVHVVGDLDPTCISICQQGNGCIFNATVTFDCDSYDSVCHGDGGDQQGCTDCPCGNNAPAGTVGGCLNGAGQSAHIEGSGIADPFADTLRFEVTGANPNTFGVLASADNLLPNNPMNPCPAGSGIITLFADGLRCVGGNFQRHGSRATDNNGDIGVTNAGWGEGDGPIGGLVAQGGFAIGDTRHWQVFYREGVDLVCQTGQNTTDAVSVEVVPPVPGTF